MAKPQRRRSDIDRLIAMGFIREEAMELARAQNTFLSPAYESWFAKRSEQHRRFLASRWCKGKTQEQIHGEWRRRVKISYGNEGFDYHDPFKLFHTKYKEQEKQFKKTSEKASQWRSRESHEVGSRISKGLTKYAVKRGKE